MNIFSKKDKISVEEENEINKQFDELKKSNYTEGDKATVLENEDEIIAKSLKGHLKEFADSIRLFFDMLKDFFSGEFKDIDVTTVAVIIGALVYVFNPIDIIPDLIPGVGLLDDAGIVGLVIKFLGGCIDKYKAYKKANPVILDGSNIAFSISNKNNSEKKVRLENIKLVVDKLVKEGYSDIVICADANLQYQKTTGISFKDFKNSFKGKYDIVEVPGNTDADKFIIEYAQRNKAIIVTNDQFRDHIESGLLKKDFYDTHHLTFAIYRDEVFFGL